MALFPPRSALPTFGKGKAPLTGKGPLAPSSDDPLAVVDRATLTVAPPLARVPHPEAMMNRLAGRPDSGRDATVPAWRKDLSVQPEASEADLVTRVAQCAQDELDLPVGLNATTALLDACRLGWFGLVAALLDRGATVTVRSQQNLSTLDLLVLSGMDDERATGLANARTDLQTNGSMMASGPTPLPEPSSDPLQRPSGQHLETFERLLAGGARFDDSILPLLAAMPLGVKLEQRALRAAMAALPVDPKVRPVPRSRL